MRNILTLAIIFTLALQTMVAAAICPHCGVDHGASTTIHSSAQQIAQQRANYMAAHGFRGHPPRSAGNWSTVGSFEGVGWSGGRRNKESIPTCTPGTGRRLVGDAVAYGRGGSFRVRIWR